MLRLQFVHCCLQHTLKIYNLSRWLKSGRIVEAFRTQPCRIETAHVPFDILEAWIGLAFVTFVTIDEKETFVSQIEQSEESLSLL